MEYKSVLYHFLILLSITEALGCSVEFNRKLSASNFLSSTASVDGGDVFFDDFTSNTLDTKKWKIAKKNWGGEISGNLSYNGGVLPENVRVENGNLVLEAHGNNYTGSLLGINRDGSIRTDGQRVGGAIATQSYFASGKYEARMKIIPVLGVVSAIWTFHYQEFYPGDPRYINKPVGGSTYYATNHEIDIEMPGRPAAAQVGMDYKYSLCNTWIGENTDEYIPNYTLWTKRPDDNEFHVFRFDWHTGGNGQTPRVEFYLDDVLQITSTSYIPYYGGRLWIAAWFANGWAGTPAFDTQDLYVDWVRITPFHEPNDQFVFESFPDDGWSDSIPSWMRTSLDINLFSDLIKFASLKL